MLALLQRFIFSISYNYSIKDFSLNIAFTKKDDKIFQKDVRAYAPINELQLVTVSDGIESIEEEAFSGYTRMYKITLGYGITIIKNAAFKKCTALKSIVFPDSLKKIEDEAFYGCTSLENITIPPSLITMELSTIFNSGSSLTSFFIPYGNKVFSTSHDNTILIKDNYTAFAGPGAFETIRIPDTVRIISSDFIRGRRNITSIDFGTAGNLRNIDNRALSYSSITEIEFPEGLSTIGSSVLEGNTGKIQRMVIPNSVTSVEYIFNGVNEIIIKENCTACQRYPDGTIYNGSKTKILLFPLTHKKYELPQNITSLDYTQLRQSIDLTNFTVDPGNNAYSDYQNSLYNSDKTYFYSSIGGIDTVYIHSECRTIGYLALSISKLKSVIFEGNKTTKILAQAFEKIGNLVSLDIPEGVTSLGSWSFYKNRLSNVSFPSTLISFEKYCFQNSGIYSADLSKCFKMETIPLGCFEHCSNLMLLKLPKNLEVISSQAFISCSGITSLTVTENVNILDESSFQFCQNLKTLIIDSIVPLSIYSHAFGGCGLVSIEFGKGTSIIYQNAFSDNFDLKEIIFEDECMLSEIQTEAFAGCKNVETVRLSKNVSAIYPGAFTLMYSLRDIFVSNESKYYHSIEGVLHSFNNEILYAFPGGRNKSEVYEKTKIIGEKAYYKCYKLIDIKFQENSILEKINGFTFSGCSGLSEIVFPSSLNSISENGFNGCTSLKTISFIGKSKLKILQKGTFTGCNFLNEVLFEEEAELKEIENGVFKGFNKLVTFICPSSLKKIGNEAFAECSSLENIKLSYIEDFGDKCFEGCKSIRCITFSNDLKYLGKDCFRDCRSLVSINYCGNESFIERSFDDHITFVKVRVSYNFTKFSNLNTWKLLDGDCKIGTSKFTISLENSISRIIFSAVLLSKPSTADNIGLSENYCRHQEDFFNFLNDVNY